MSTASDTNLQRWGWATSLLLHATVVVAGSYLVFRPPQYGVAVAPTSTEVDLVQDEPPEITPPSPPVPVPTITPPVPDVPPILPRPDDVTIPLPPPPQPALPKPATAPRQKVVHHAERPRTAASQGSQSAAPDYLRNPPPVYPDESQRAGEKGTVLLEVDVDTAGNAQSVTVRKSSGFPRLDRAAVDAVRRWKFHPALVAGMAVESTADVPVRFELQ